MASSLLEGLPAATGVVDTDITYLVQSPGATPTDKQITIGSLRSALSTIKSVVVNVGVGARQSKTATVTDAACLTTSTVLCQWGAVLPTDENDPECDDIAIRVTPAAGSVVVLISSPDHLPSVQGAYRLAYQIG